MKVEKSEEKNHRLIKINQETFHIYFLCSLTDRQTDKIFTEYMIIDLHPFK